MCSILLLVSIRKSRSVELFLFLYTHTYPYNTKVLKFFMYLFPVNYFNILKVK